VVLVKVSYKRKSMSQRERGHCKGSKAGEEEEGTFDISILSFSLPRMQACRTKSHLLEEFFAYYGKLGVDAPPLGGVPLAFR
jgi:hypothetical protein